MLHVTLDSRYIATLSSLLMLAYFFPHQSSSLSLGITAFNSIGKVKRIATLYTWGDE